MRYLSHLYHTCLGQRRLWIWDAGEYPSNSSFRRAMRKASGTVSIVDKDALCYTKLVTIFVAKVWCSPPFRDFSRLSVILRRHLEVRHVPPWSTLQLAARRIFWDLLGDTFVSRGGFGVSMKPTCQHWSKQLTSITVSWNIWCAAGQSGWNYAPNCTSKHFEFEQWTPSLELYSHSSNSLYYLFGPMRT